jgi:hypothetical protein
VSADPSASIWEVTRLILESPGVSPSAIAHAHGFSAVEVVGLLPIFLENVRSTFSPADGPSASPAEVAPPPPLPGEDAEQHAERYLRELAGNEQLDVVGYDSLGASGAGDDPTFLDAVAGHDAGDTAAADDAPGEPGGPDEPPDDSAASVDGPVAGYLVDQPDAGTGAGAVPAPQEPDPGLDLLDDDPFVSLVQPADVRGADPDEPPAPDAIE